MIGASAEPSAHFAAVGFSSFQTKNRTMPSIGIQQNDNILTAQFGPSGLYTV